MTQTFDKQIASDIDEWLKASEGGESRTYLISQAADGSIHIDHQSYQLVVNHGEGFDLEALKDRWTEYFNDFDFILGDWASDKLRLKGFYQLKSRQAAYYQRVQYLTDYLLEYCNFGCRYFILAKEEASIDYQKLYDQLAQEDFIQPKLSITQSRPVTRKHKSLAGKKSRRRQSRDSFRFSKHAKPSKDSGQELSHNTQHKHQFKVSRKKHSS